MSSTGSNSSNRKQGELLDTKIICPACRPRGPQVGGMKTNIGKTSPFLGRAAGKCPNRTCTHSPALAWWCGDSWEDVERISDAHGPHGIYEALIIKLRSSAEECRNTSAVGGHILSILLSLATLAPFSTIRWAGFQSINQEAGLAQDVPPARTVG